MRVDVVARMSRHRLSGMDALVECDLGTATQPGADLMTYLKDRAIALCKLPAGWDHSDAPVVNRAALEHAITLAAQISCPECLLPDITPTRSGNVLLSWTYGSEHVEIEVSSNGDLDGLVELPGVNHEFSESSPHDQIHQLLAHWVTGVGLSRFNLSF